MSKKETGLRRILREQGRSLTWIAGKTNVSISTVSRWGGGTLRIPVAKRQALADLLGVDEEDLR